MKTKILAAILACLMIIPPLSVSISAEEEKEIINIGDFGYVLFPEEMTASVAAYTGESSIVRVPAYISYNGGTYTVRSLEDSVFVGNTFVEEITLPATLSKLGKFSNMLLLKKVTLKCSAIKEIPAYAFSYCEKLEEIVFPSGMKDIAIGEGAFKYCRKLRGDISGLEIVSLGKDAFYCCNSLEEVILGKNFSYYHHSMFNGYCEGIVTVDPENKKFYSIGGDLFERVECPDTGYQSYYGDILLRHRSNHLETLYEVPENVGIIGKFAFANSWLKTIILSDNTYRIEDKAFYSCDWLTLLVDKNPEITVGKNAFELCYSFGTVKHEYDYSQRPYTSAYKDVQNVKERYLSDCVVRIGGMSYFIYNNEAKLFSCTETTPEVIIPDTVNGLPVTEILNYAFRTTLAIKKVTVPDSVKKIHSMAFYNSGIVDLIIGDGTEILEPLCFADCKALQSVTIGKGLKAINHDAFMGCADLGTITVDPDNPYLTSLNNIVYDKAFTTVYVCPTLQVGTATLPHTVKKVNDRAFYGCKFLAGVKLPSSLEIIGKQAFCGCTRFTSIAVPDTLTQIGCRAFYGCNSLKEFTLFTVKKTDGASLASDYSVDDGAFYECSSLASVKLPPSVKYLYQNAFYGCRLIKEIAVPEGTEEIYSNTFSSCESLKVIQIPKSVTRIDENAFQNCNAITDVYYGSSSHNRSMLRIDGTGNEGFTSANVKWHYEESGNSVLGDINGDQKINPVDGNILICIIIGNIKFSEANFLSADINLDGKVNAADSYILKKMILGNY